MVYNNNIPQPSNNLSVSQGDLLGNFGTQGIDSTTFGFSRDHTTMTDATNGGTHKKSTYVEQVAGPTTIANQMAVYCKEVSSVSELFLRRESNGTEIQMSVGSPTAATSGQTFLPGGIILKWAQATLTTNNELFTFATAFPTACFGVLACNRNSGGNVSYFGASGFNVSGFNLVSGGGTRPSNFFYLAIGN